MFDPRLKIIGFLALIINTLIIEEPLPLALLLIYILALHVSSHLDRSLLVRSAWRISPFVALVFTINLLFSRGDGSPELTSAVKAGIFYSLRMLVLLYSAVVFANSTKPEEFAGGLAGIFRPLSRSASSRLALYGFIAFGAVPIFSREIKRIRTAQRFRGGGLRGGIRAKLRGVPSLLIPLILSAVHKSARLSTAVEIRGLENNIGKIIDLDRPASSDYVWITILIVLLIFAHSGLQG